MALQRKSPKGMYLRVAKGKLRQKIKEPTATSKLRIEEKDGVTHNILEEVFESLTGKVVSVRLYDGSFGEQWIVTIADGPDNYNVTMPVNSRYSSSFMERLPGIDFDQPILISPYDFENKEGNRNSGVTIYQPAVQDKENKVPSYFRKYDDEGNFLRWKHKHPEPKQDASKAEFKIYLIERDEFYKTFIMENIAPNISKENPVDNADNKEFEGEVDSKNIPNPGGPSRSASDDVEDDLPF